MSSLSLSSRLSRISLFGALVASTFGACTCEDPGPEPGNRPSLIAQFPDGTELQSDGVSTLTVNLVAQNDRAPDTSTILLTPDPDLILPDGNSVTPDDDGRAAITVQCVPNVDGRRVIAADNGNAQANINIECTEPEGDVLIDVDTDDCDSIQADGVDRCLVVVTVKQNANGVILPVTGPMDVRVAATDPPDGDDDVLTLVDGNAGSNAISVNLVEAEVDDETVGRAEFEVLAPEVAERLTLEVQVGDAVQAAEIDIPEFENQASIVFDGPGNVVGGEQATINVTVRGSDGELAANENVAVSLAEGDSVSIADSEVTLDENGTGAITITTDPVNATETARIVVAYEFIPGVAPITNDFVINVTEAGAIILDVVANPAVVQSDVVGERTSTLTVTFAQDGTAVPGGAVNLTIGDPTRLRFEGGEVFRAIPASAFDAEGVATVEVSASAGVAPGLVTITAVGSASGEDDVSDTVVIEVERAPVLSSMTPGAPEPAVIGVIGSALPTSTEVTFTLRDDRNQPMENVLVTFTSPDTADREISIVSTGVSNASGEVSTILTAGTIAGPVTVIATAGDLPPVPSPTIIIVGGLPNQQSSFMSCGDAIPNVEGEPFDCTVSLADRFTDFVPDQGVQFRAESSGTNATATTGDDGTASANLTLDDGDTRSFASVPAWSFGFIPQPGDASFDPGCFDDTTSTPCDLLQICADDPSTCPVRTGCLGRANAARAAIAGGLSLRDPEIVDYFEDFRACGFPVSCLGGDVAEFEGVLDLAGDECTLAPGCFDYSASTECPHDGLVTVVASTRGEEGLGDGNGNGILDFDDENGNRRHDRGEPIDVRNELCISGACEVSGDACTSFSDCVPNSIPVDTFVDLPETFLDKNDNCARDDLTNSPRLPFAGDRVQHTDLFNDVDANGGFGFDVDGQSLERNGAFDADTEIFLSAHVLVFGNPSLVVGSACTPGSAGCVEGVATGAVVGIDPAGVPATLGDGQSVTLRYRWADGFGNCVSEAFGGTVSATAEGPVQLTGQTEIELNEQNCGFASAPNAFARHCDDLPVLGAPFGTITITADCADEDELATITFANGDVEESISIFMDCAP